VCLDDGGNCDFIRCGSGTASVYADIKDKVNCYRETVKR
jgi:hypothetical protein